MTEQKERAVFWWSAIIGLVTFWTMLGVLLWPMLAGANPFLVCDPPTTGGTVEYYKVNGLASIDPTTPHPPHTDGSMRVDMAGTPDGTHTVTAQACNIWGCSIDSDPFTFTAGVPAQSSGLGMVP